MSQFGDAGRSIPPWSLLLPGWFCCASRDLSSVLPSGTTQFARRKQRRDTAMLSFCGCILVALVDRVGLFVVVSVVL